MCVCTHDFSRFFPGIGFRRLLCRDYVFTVPGTIPEKREERCDRIFLPAEREGEEGWWCCEAGEPFLLLIFFSVCLYPLSRDSISISLPSLFHSLVSRQAHKLHTEMVWWGGGGEMYRTEEGEKNSFQRVAVVLD